MKILCTFNMDIRQTSNKQLSVVNIVNQNMGDTLCNDKKFQRSMVYLIWGGTIISEKSIDGKFCQKNVSNFNQICIDDINQTGTPS